MCSSDLRADMTCDGCPSGSFSSTSGMADCTTWRTCPVGDGMSNAGSSEADRQCKPCVTGETFSTADNGNACDAVRNACQPGQYLKFYATPSTDMVCDDCADGFFTDVAGQTSCAKWAVCAIGEGVSRTPSAANNRECGACVQDVSFSQHVGTPAIYARRRLAPKKVSDVPAADVCIATNALYAEGARCMDKDNNCVAAGSGTSSYRETVNWCCSEYGISNNHVWGMPQVGSCPVTAAVPTTTTTTTTSVAPINGGWSNWGSLEACSVTGCGLTGTRTMRRTCSNPVPAYGGADCVGLATDSSSTCATACCDGTFNDSGTCATWRTCAAGFGIDSEGSATSDRTCAACTGTTFSNTDDGQPCSEASTCGSGEYQTKAVTPKTDATCATHAATCASDEYQTQAPTDRKSVV